MAFLVHFPLEHPLGVHELAIHLASGHHGEQHGQHHGLLVDVLLAGSLLEGRLERVYHMSR